MTEAITTSVKAGAREWWALSVLTLGVVILSVDGTVLALAVPALVDDLGASTTQILWIGDIYSFMLAGLLITMGNVADRIGRKRLLLMGSAGFGVASVFAAFATSPEMLIAARALLGISGATLMPSTLSLVRGMFDDAVQRTRAIAIWSAGAVSGSAAGPLIGGALLEHFHWGAVFLINVPVVAVVIVAGFFLIPESRNPERAKIDLLSAALSIAAIIPLVYSVKHVVGSGIDVSTIVGAVIGIAAGVLFVRRQQKLSTPLIDVNLFRIPAFSGAVSAVTLTIFAFSGLLFFFSQYLQLVRGFGPFQAGISQLPLTIASLLVIFIVGVLVGRLGRGRAIGAGLGVAAVGLAVLSVAESLDGYFWIGAALALLGVGVGVAMTLGTDAVVSSVPTQRAGAAAAVSETSYELGVALGIAVLGSLQVAIYRGVLVVGDAVTPEVGAAVRDSLAGAHRVLDAGDPVLAAAQHAFTTGMQVTSMAAAVLLAVAAVVAWRVIPSGTASSDTSHH